VSLFVAVSEAEAWYKGCYEMLNHTQNISVSVGFVSPVDCGQVCLDRG